MHQLDGPGSQHPRPVQLAAAAQHLAEAQIVVGGPGQAAAAGLEARIAGEVAGEWSTEELDASELTPKRLGELEQRYARRALDGKGWAFLVILIYLPS